MRYSTPTPRSLSPPSTLRPWRCALVTARVFQCAECVIQPQRHAAFHLPLPKLQKVDFKGLGVLASMNVCEGYLQCKPTLWVQIERIFLYTSTRSLLWTDVHAGITLFHGLQPCTLPPLPPPSITGAERIILHACSCTLIWRDAHARWHHVQATAGTVQE